jgi:outer membrane protein, multidrug efflux system
MTRIYRVKKACTLLPLLYLIVFISGCTVGPDFEQPELSAVMQDEWQTTPEDSDQLDHLKQPDTAWWNQFHDDVLSNLITRLQSSSLALAQARERIVEITARQGIIEADKRLQLAAALGYTRAEAGDEAVSLQGIPAGKTLDVYSTGVVASWELDLWGRTTRLLEAGEEDIRAGYAGYQDMMVSLSAELTLAYIEARTFEARLAKVQENIALQNKTLELTRSRFEAGNGSALEVVRAERLLSSTRSRLPQLQRSLVVAKNRLNVLLGLPPKEQLLHSGSLPMVPPMIGLGLPADLLTRRADIRQALHRYHSGVARVGAVEAEKYPALSISGTLTLSSDSLGGVFDTDSLLYSLGPELRFPILTGRRIESNIAVRKSQAEQARLGLEQQIITALSEVENASIGVLRTQQQVTELEHAEKSAQKSVSLSNDLYLAGLGDLFQVLDNQQQLVTIQESLLLARQQVLSEVVFLYRALGGGWENQVEQQGNEEIKNK